jgi:hypothetical protein
MAAAVSASPAGLGRREYGPGPVSIHHGTGTAPKHTSFHHVTEPGTGGHHPTPSPTTCTKTTSITLTYTLGSGSVVTTTAIRTYTEVDYIVSRALIAIIKVTNNPLTFPQTDRGCYQPYDDTYRHCPPYRHCGLSNHHRHIDLHRYRNRYGLP